MRVQATDIYRLVSFCWACRWSIYQRIPSFLLTVACDLIVTFQTHPCLSMPVCYINLLSTYVTYLMKVVPCMFVILISSQPLGHTWWSCSPICDVFVLSLCWHTILSHLFVPFLVMMLICFYICLYAIVHSFCSQLMCTCLIELSLCFLPIHI